MQFAAYLSETAIIIHGVKLIGIDERTGEKVVFTIVFLAFFVIVRFTLTGLSRTIFSRYNGTRARFWSRQGINVATTILVVLGLISIWFDNPANLATGAGLASAGLAFALQQLIASIAGYLVILRGKTFNVGDRITMGGVRGDVIALGFIQTTIMEMGQPAAVQGADPAVWVMARQFTGRIVTVTNSKIFDEPVFNYSREFPLIWEEMRVPVTYTCDRERAEAILIDAATRHTHATTESGRAALEAMMRRFPLVADELEPRVFYRITDNWLELTVRFLAPLHGIRALKDAMSRDILREFDIAKIGIASATYDIVGFPDVRLATTSADAKSPVTGEQIS